MRNAVAAALLSAAPALLAAADPAPSIDGLPIGALRPQPLPARGCAAYLFSTGRTRTLAAVAQAEPGTLRLALDGRMGDLARAEQSGAGSFGFAGETVYRRADVTATLQMTIVERPDLRQGASVSGATLRIDRAGQDSVVVPLGGLVGCAA